MVWKLKSKKVKNRNNLNAPQVLSVGLILNGEKYD